MERITGIEPAASAWEAEVLPLDYIRITPLLYTHTSPLVKEKFSTIYNRNFLTADQREGNEGKYRVGFSATPEYDPDNILISQKSATVEGIREGLKGLADGT